MYYFLGKSFTRPGPWPAPSAKKPSPHRNQQKTARLLWEGLRKKKKKDALSPGYHQGIKSNIVGIATINMSA